MRVASVEEAIARANASAYGLSASVWTRDLQRGREIAGRLEAGTVMINDVVTEAAMLEVAHGGTKASGTGRLHGTIGLREGVWPKTIVNDSFPRWRQLWWFPYSRRLHDGMSYFFDFLHGPGLLSRAASGFRAIALL